MATNYNIPSDIEIAQAAKMLHVEEIAAKMGLDPKEDIDLYGKYKAKIDLSVLEKFKDRKNGYYIDVTAITPTPLGEGKTVTTIGLTQALGKVLEPKGKKVFCTLRQPSMGPVFGIKGGAAGGGYSQIIPMEDFNLHFTGDAHAVSAAHNLLAAMIDASILHKNTLNIDPLTILWRRVVDMSDRALREIVIGLGGKDNGYPRQTGYDITVASEIMAILALTTGLKDIRQRLSRIVVGFTYDGKPVTADDLKATGAMTVLMKDAIKPNLIQTLEHQPCIVHAGPFANIAHGNNSVLADKIALKLADYVVTESGFGADCGMEKFMNIKCRQSGLIPNCVVITLTIRALKMHGGVGKVVAGKPLPKELTQENLDAVKKGAANLGHMIKIAKYFNVPVVVTINRRTEDTDNEVKLIKDLALQYGADACEAVEVWAKGGDGGIAAAEAVIKACEKSDPKKFQLLYPDNITLQEKIEILAKKVYNADGAKLSDQAKKQLDLFQNLGWGNLPINMAKTHLSISHKAEWKGVPSNYIFEVTDARASVGAGFIYPLAGTMRTMPGLPSRPAAVDIDITDDGKVLGLF